jgi:hypothetical protein
MEETEQNQNPFPQEEVRTPSPAPEVGFPVTTPQTKKGINKWIFVLIGLLILGVGGVILFTRGSGETESTLEPTAEPIATIAPSPTSTPKAADKAKVAIQVKNGTGITGEAGYLSEKLKEMGYTKVTTGNADKENYVTTEVTFNKSLDLAIQDEITKKLESLYQKVEVKSSSTQTSDVVIITGLKKGATAKPSSSPTATPKVTTSPSASPTSTATATPTPTASGN